jgi:hypothetical protein
MRFILAVSLGICVCALSATAVRAQANQTINVAGEPPAILNVVHQLIIPGKGSEYTHLLDRIAQTYQQAQIPVYWVQSQSLTGSRGEMSLNFFDSFADAESVSDSLTQAIPRSPGLAQMQEQLLSYVSSETNAIALRRDDISYRATSVDFSKARILRVATILVRQGHEEEFAEAIKGLRDAHERLNANAFWVTYQVNAGAPSTTFVILMPMRSLKEMDDYIARSRQLRDAEGPTIAARLQEIARNAYVSWDSELFVVDAAGSHVSREFAAGDPRFWQSAKH